MQDALNIQVIDAANCLAKLMPSYIKDVSVENKDDYVDVILNNPTQPDLPIWLSTNGEEITLFFAESHFHINEYGDEVVPESLVEEMVSAIFRLITGVDLAYSAWNGDRSLGGGFVEAKPNLEEIKSSFRKANEYKVYGWLSESNMSIKA